MRFPRREQHLTIGGTDMGKVLVITSLALAVSLSLLSSAVFAQSSGNFAAAVNTVKCQIESNGNLTGGTAEFLTTTIKTPNAGSTALLIGASLGVGLFTDTLSTGKNSSSTANAEVVVHVRMCPGIVDECTDRIQGSVEVAPSPVVYEQRFQKLTTNLGNLIEGCLVACVPESVELLLSTLSAHHFNFAIGAVGGGNHTLTLSWVTTNSTDTGGVIGNTATASSCVGPGVLTVEQVKTFSQSGGITIQ
jgi:hypothetical protein